MVEEKSTKVEAAESPSQVQEKAPNRDSSEKALLLLPVDSLRPNSQLFNKRLQLENSVGDSIDRDAALARVEIEKRFALIKAWEDSEKTKAHNKAYKKLSAIGGWENTKRASVEAQLKQIEEQFEKKKATYVEKMKNQIADIHRSAQEKRAVVDAKLGQDTLKVEEAAEKFRATGNTPKKLFECLSY